MSITSVGQQGPVSPINTNSQVPNGRPQQTQATDNNQTNGTTKPTGAQPLNASGRGQVVNLVV
jgi:hypothetical protein